MGATIARVLETEAMDTAEEATAYDSMDHRAVNQQFVADLIAAGHVAGDILDLGTGTAQIPVTLCREVEDCRVLAVDLAVSMLDIARYNIEVAGLIERIMLDHIDGKDLPYENHNFDVVMSNSIVHHVPEPMVVLSEAIRVTRPGGLLFFRDLVRPADETELNDLVERYSGGDDEIQQAMFRDSLRASLTVNEVREMLSALGQDPEAVRATSDRHWSWAAVLPKDQ
jgi:ubiquinone/menaquinone biosynthesis C-methylase UbiE